MASLLEIQNLKIQVGDTTIVDNVTFKIAPCEIVGLVGGSGSGKTTIGLAILRLLDPALRMTSGIIEFEHSNLLQYSAIEMTSMRGKRIGMVFQEPLQAFNPLLTIGQQMDEVLKAHTPLNQIQRRDQIFQTLMDVELKDADRIYQAYPHQLSGGMRQRAMIAQAIVCHPSLIIADEPTSSLDVTSQSKIMELFVRLKDKRKLSILLISHDLAMVGRLADTCIVLNKGRIVESGQALSILKSPKHPYTKQLVEAI